MLVHPARMTGTQSLPSFAQTFGQAASDPSPDSHRLPPIIPGSRPASRTSPLRGGRKRALIEVSRHDRDGSLPARYATYHDLQSSVGNLLPSELPIKQEEDQDELDPALSHHRLYQSTSHLEPDVNPSKRRRVIEAHGIDTDVRQSNDQAGSTPISPVVMGLTVPGNSAADIEKVRAMQSVRQKQEELIAQRVSNGASSTSSMMPNIQPSDERTSTCKTTPLLTTRPMAGTPPSTGALRRISNSQCARSRPPSPGPSNQNNIQVSVLPPPNSPPAISIARRRALQLGAAGKKKPADIIISPRDAHTYDQFHPVIQSAPPVPHAGQNSLRFPMDIPRLPSVLGSDDKVRRMIPSKVPPTPTRLYDQRNLSSSSLKPSPRTAFVPISSALVPPTPSSLHHPGYSGDKSAFLAPFELFYDALNDSKQLKTWLGEQLQKSNALFKNLSAHQERIDETVDALIERKVAPMRTEITALRRRVDELEDALRLSTRRASLDGAIIMPSKGKGKQSRKITATLPDAQYTFPPHLDPPLPSPLPDYPIQTYREVAPTASRTTGYPLSSSRVISNPPVSRISSHARPNTTITSDGNNNNGGDTDMDPPAIPKIASTATSRKNSPRQPS
ncbi:hypothetical protein FISHEDRAFT_77233 [Fistulina hepatica ATCC 64428]|uniref:Uncharacterized protein n=1 Tax=Fistulina hepatica ATCC 64428 TaxID=1128425 RepID=A0A0D7A203_9AGAR|nr:hypothetical protein FISHEDRAFT_77233 [Fistulina hepatica ATCC 64428]